MANETEKKSLDLTQIVSTAIQIPGVKVNRDAFLKEIFKSKSEEELALILKVGPVEAKCSKQELHNKAAHRIRNCTIVSTALSTLAGIPGGLAMLATVPADTLQFFGSALRLAQELVYLYGEEDMWDGDSPDVEKIDNQLILYCGVMLGASGASQAVRVLSSKLAQQALIQLPKKTLTKGIIYPVVKSVCRFFGVKVVKDSFAKTVSKAIPIVGGVVSGGITWATLYPMGKKLMNTLEKAHFDYAAQEFRDDWQELNIIAQEEKSAETETFQVPSSEHENAEDSLSLGSKTVDHHSALDELTRAKGLLDSGVITEDEFATIKAKIIETI